MVIKRRMSQRGRTTKRRRMNISRPPTKRMFRRSLVKLACKRTLYVGNWTFGTASATNFWRYQSITAASAINNFAELANVFDEYKINAIKWTYRPAYDSVQAPSAAGTIAQPQGYAHVIIDPESIVTAPTGTYVSSNLNSFLENGGVKTYTLNRPFSVYWKPKIEMAAVNGTTAVRPRYLRTTNTTEVHRGHHIFLQQNNFVQSNTNISLDMYVTVYFTMRNLK